MSETGDTIPLTESSSLTNSSKSPGRNATTSNVGNIKEWCKKTWRQLFPTGFKAELKSLISLAFPLLISGILFMSLTLTPLFFCGHLESTVELDVAALAITIIDTTIFAIGYGIANACNTYTSQAFASNEKEKIGLFLQTAIYVTILTVLPIIALHINIASFLCAIGQDATISKLVGDYMLVMIPGTICYYIFEVLDKYMVAQCLVLPTTLSVATAAMLNVVLHYIFIELLHLGLLGSALSMSLSFIYMLVFMFLYIRLRKYHIDSWNGFRIESLLYFVPYTKLAYASMFQVCSELWVFEIGIFLAGYLSQIELGAQSIVTNLDIVWNQVPVSVYTAVLTMSGQYISVSNIDGVKTFYRVALTVTLSFTLIYDLVIIVWSNSLCELFTNKREVSEAAANLMVLIAVYSVFYGINMIFNALLLGIGRHLWAFKVTLVGYYLVSFPIGISLMFATELHSKGFYIGIAVGSVSKFIYLCYIVHHIDWHREVVNAKNRLAGTEIDSEEIELSRSILSNRSQETHSKLTNTTEMGNTANTTNTSSSFIQRLLKIINAYDISSRVIQIGVPVISIAIFIVGIICKTTIHVPAMDSDFFTFNKSAILHSL